MSRWTSQVLAGMGWWALVSATFTLQRTAGAALAGRPVRLERFAWGEAVTFLPWALLTPFIFWVCRRAPLVGTRSLGRHLAVHALALLACGLVHTGVAMGLAHLKSRAADARPPPRFMEVYGRTLGAHLLVYAAVVGVQHALAFHRAWRTRELQASQLQAQLAQAQLEAVRTQLQPHFLFNALHAVSAQMGSDVTAARRTLARLSELLRLSLVVDAPAEVTLDEELAFLTLYLELQRTRFEDRLEVALDVAEEARGAAVPRLLLQPLVENALRHGLAPSADGGRLEVRAWREGGRLVMEVRDDGVGLPAGASSAPREGLGLRHTRARLNALHPGQHAFRLSPRGGGGVVVHLELPYRRV